jgi:hypothetical protein
MRTVFRVLLTAVIVLNLAMGGVVPAMACHTAKPAMKQGCCCCGGQAMQESGCSEESVKISPADGCGCNLKAGNEQSASEFTLNNTSDKLQYTIMPTGITAAALHIQDGIRGAKSVKDFCAVESPPIYKLTSSYLC